MEPIMFCDLSIIVPAFNEEHRITPTLDQLHAFLAAQPLRWEIVVVDDGSSDRTTDVVTAKMATIPNLRLLRQTPNRGKGAAVRMGMLGARGQIRVMSDADGSMAPDQLTRLLAPIIACKAEIAIGSRYAPGAKADQKQPAYRVLWSRLANKVIQRLQGVHGRGRAGPVRARQDRWLGVRPRDPRARAPPRLRHRRGRGGVEGRPALARESAQGHLEGREGGRDDPAQPEGRRLQRAAARRVTWY